MHCDEAAKEARAKLFSMWYSFRPPSVFFTLRLEIFQFHFFITTEIYQSSEKKMISHQTSEKKSMSVHNNFL
jgi:hypothetical protein